MTCRTADGEAGGNVLCLWQVGHTLTVRVPRDLAEWLEHEAKRTGVSQGRIVRDQLERLKRVDSGQAFLRHAGAVRGARDLSGRKGFSRS